MIVFGQFILSFPLFFTNLIVFAVTFIFSVSTRVVCTIFFFFFFFVFFHFTGQDLQLPRGKGHKRTSTSLTKVPHLTHPTLAYERQPQQSVSTRVVCTIFVNKR